MVDKRFVIGVGEHFVVCDEVKKADNLVFATLATGEVLPIKIDEIDIIIKELVQKEEVLIQSL